MIRKFCVLVLVVVDIWAVDSSVLNASIAYGNGGLENLVNDFIRVDHTIFVINWARGDAVAWKQLNTPTIMFSSKSIARIQQAIPPMPNTFMFIVERNSQLKKIDKLLRTAPPFTLEKLIVVILHGQRRSFSFKKYEHILLINHRPNINKVFAKKIATFVLDTHKIKVKTHCANQTPTVRYNKINAFLYDLYNFNMKMYSMVVLTIYLALWVLYEMIYNCLIVKRPRHHRLNPINIFLVMFSVHHNVAYRFKMKLKLFQQIMLASLLLYVIVINGMFSQTIIDKIFINYKIDRNDCCKKHLNFNYRFISPRTLSVSCGRSYLIDPEMLVRKLNVTTENFIRFVDHAIFIRNIKLSNKLRISREHKNLKIIKLGDLEMLFQVLGCSLVATILVFCGEIIVDKWQRGKFMVKKLVMKNLNQ